MTLQKFWIIDLAHYILRIYQDTALAVYGGVLDYRLREITRNLHPIPFNLDFMVRGGPVRRSHRERERESKPYPLSHASFIECQSSSPSSSAPGTNTHHDQISSASHTSDGVGPTSRDPGHVAGLYIASCCSGRIFFLSPGLSLSGSGQRRASTAVGAAVQYRRDWISVDPEPFVSSDGGRPYG